MHSEKQKVKTQLGMTLVEVLVALAILAMVAASVLSLISQNARFMTSTEERLLAGIVADNLMVESLAQTAALERGEDQGTIEFGGRSWLYRQNILEPNVEGLVRIEITVQPEGGNQIAGTAMTLKKE